VPPGQGRQAVAHPRWPAHRLPQPRRGDPHHPPRGRAEARPHEALQALRRADRGDPEHAPAPSGQARRAENPRGAEDARGRARGRSLQPVVFIDSTGRTYTLPAHSLASARGQGEPLSGRLDPPDGAKFAGVMIGEPEDLWLLASDAGYGFTVRLKDLITDRRA